MNNLHVKKGDLVVILSGKDKGKKGKILETSPKEGKVIVEGCNMVSKHVKPRRQGEAGGGRQCQCQCQYPHRANSPPTGPANHAPGRTAHQRRRR